MNWIIVSVLATVLGLFAWPSTSFAAAKSAVASAGQQVGSSDPTTRNVLAAAPIVVAQAATATPASLTAPIGLISPTASITPTVTITQTGSPTAIPTIRRTSVVTTQVIPGLSPTPTPGPTDDEDNIDAEDSDADEVEAEAEPLEGTIVSNRTGLRARFFIEGETIELGADMATSFELPRSTTVLNLYNCAASTPESNTDCYWDPYVLQRDGFFEIYQSRAARAGTVARFMLRAADAPPADQVWVQNRSSNIESIVFRNEVIELVPAAVEEFAVDPGLPAILYVRSCITMDGQMACEWSPKSLQAGIYYALTAVETSASPANSTVTTIELRAVVGEVIEVETDSDLEATGETGNGPAITAGSPTDVVCRVLVPALNIRSGPGLQYQIIGKIFSSEAEPGDVRMIGRNSDTQWLVVDPVVMPNGWVTASTSFIECNALMTNLPLVQAPPLPVVEQVPAPAVVTADEESGDDADDTQDASEAPAGEGEESDTDTAATDTALPEGYSQLVVNNGFEHPIRFTLDQQYRTESGPSEFDLQPGQSTTIVVFPGRVTFSASSPWAGGLSGNTLINVDSDTTVPLWLRFAAESAGAPASEWKLAWD